MVLTVAGSLLPSSNAVSSLDPNKRQSNMHSVLGFGAKTLEALIVFSLVSGRVGLLEVPKVSAHRLKILFRHEAELLLRQCRIGRQVRYVSQSDVSAGHESVKGS